jgi:hypothetical protein
MRYRRARAEMRLGACQQFSAVAVERIDLVQLAQHSNRLNIAPGIDMIARLLVEFRLMIALHRRWRRRGARRWCAS